MGDNKGLWWGCGVFCVLGLITGIILISVSFAGLEATEFGIAYSSYSKKFDETKVYEQGTYFLGPSSRFIKFPLEIKSVTFNKDFTIRTADGMRLSLAVSFQFKLSKRLDLSIALIRNWGEGNLDQSIDKISRDSVRTTASGFIVDTYVYEKSKVSDRMKANLSDDLNNMGVSLENFQLTEVVFPTAFSEIISETQKQEIAIKNAQNNRLKAIDSANGDLAKANTDAGNIFNNEKSSIINEIAILNQKKLVYVDFLPLYNSQLVVKKALYGSALWYYEYMETINSKVNSGQWKDLKQVMITPSSLKDIFN
jgi:regulator of protease activity HflC (stomatin/prohibitin superfamily)